MFVAISNGIVILLLFFQNTSAQQAVNNAQPKATCNTAGINFNSVQPGQQINWQQSSNMQLPPVSQQPQNYQQPGIGSQMKQQNVNPLSDIFSALQSLRFSSPKSQLGIPTATSGCNQAQIQNQLPSASINSQNQQYNNPITEYPKPTFTFQFVPVPPQTGQENSLQNSVPVQILSNGQTQMTSQTGPSYYTQTNGMTSQQVPTAQIQTSGQNQPIVFTVNSQQPAGQSQPMVYTLQPAQRSGNQQKSPQPAQPNVATDNPMALLMSQLQSSSSNPDIASILPMLMGSKQEKSGMKALLPLLLNLLTDRGCGCPHCGCPYNNAEPTINGGYSNQVNYSQGLTDATKIPESNKRADEQVKKYKTNEINDNSEEVSDEDDEYEYDDD